jgi:hypothetical protein
MRPNAIARPVIGIGGFRTPGVLEDNGRGPVDGFGEASVSQARRARARQLRGKRVRAGNGASPLCLGRLPAPAIVVLTSDCLAVSSGSAQSVVIVAAEFAWLVAAS